MKFDIGGPGRAWEEVREGTVWVHGGRAFQAVGTASTKALRQEGPWHLAGRGKPVCLGQGEQRA